LIPARVPADAVIHTVGGTRELSADHPLFAEDCPVCDAVLGSEPITLVLVGFHPEDRKPSGWTTGATVAVHAECAGIRSSDGGQP
jgi:hypothetical protein